MLARSGDFEQAERLARDAVALTEKTDGIYWHGVQLTNLAEVLRLSGRLDEAVSVFEQALELQERKGNLASAVRTRAALADLRQGVGSER